MEYPDDRYPELNIYISEVIFDSYEYTAAAHVKMHCMISPYLSNVANFFGTAAILTRYSNGHTK